MNQPVGALFATVALALSAMPVMAQENPYGPVLDLLFEGSRYEAEGNFVEAQRLYEEALGHSQRISDSLVRYCAVSESSASLQSLAAAQAYIDLHGTNPQTLQAAQEVAEQQFYLTWEAFEQAHPELSTEPCP